MTSWALSTFLQNVREQIAPDVQDFVGGIPQEVRTALETGIRGALTLARPLFGPNEVGDGLSLFPEPVLNVNDTTSESASVLVPDDVYLFSLGLLDIGGRFGPLSELFSQAVNLNFDRDADDDDAEQVLKEIIGWTFLESKLIHLRLALTRCAPSAYVPHLQSIGKSHEGQKLVEVGQGPGAELRHRAAQGPGLRHQQALSALQGPSGLRFGD